MMLYMHYVLSMKHISKLMMMQISTIIYLLALNFHLLNLKGNEDVKLDHTYALGTSQTVQSMTGYVSVRFTGGTEIFRVSSTTFHQAVPCNHKQLLLAWPFKLIPI